MIKYILIIFMFIGSCKVKKTNDSVRCCDKDTAHALWNCGNDIQYKYKELLTKNKKNYE